MSEASDRSGLARSARSNSSSMATGCQDPLPAEQDIAKTVETWGNSGVFRPKSPRISAVVTSASEMQQHPKCRAVQDIPQDATEQCLERALVRERIHDHRTGADSLGLRQNRNANAAACPRPGHVPGRRRL